MPTTSSPVTLVTGANKGIGLETVRRLKRAGHHVYLAARDEGRGGSAAESVDAVFVQLDSTDDDSVAAAARAVEEQDGRLDVLINNAGITGPVRDVHDYTGDDIAPVLLTDLAGYLRVIHAFLPLLERAADPQIINVSSGIGSFGYFHDPDRIERDASTPLYGAAKAGINMLTVRYARLLPNIRINAADPGMTDTDLSGGEGHSVEEGTDAIVALAVSGPDGPTGTFRDRDGEIPW